MLGRNARPSAALCEKHRSTTSSLVESGPFSESHQEPREGSDQQIGLEDGLRSSEQAQHVLGSQNPLRTAPPLWRASRCASNRPRVARSESVTAATAGSCLLPVAPKKRPGAPSRARMQKRGLIHLRKDVSQLSHDLVDDLLLRVGRDVAAGADDHLVIVPLLRRRRPLRVLKGRRVTREMQHISIEDPTG